MFLVYTPLPSREAGGQAERCRFLWDDRIPRGYCGRETEEAVENNHRCKYGYFPLQLEWRKKQRLQSKQKGAE